MKELSQVPASSTFTIHYPSFSFESSYTGVTQYAERMGAHWKISVTYPLKTGEDLRRLRVLVNSLHGRVGKIKVYDHTRLGAPAKGVPVVAQNGMRGRYLNTYGWNAETLVLRAGDLITVDDELKEIEEDCYSSSDGRATIKFNPPLRKRSRLNAPIITHMPYAVCHLDMDGVEINNQLGGFADFGTLEFIEAIYS